MHRLLPQPLGDPRIIGLLAGPGLSAVAGSAQLAALGERAVFERADGTHERRSPGLLAGRQRTCLGPAGELAVRGEPQRLDLVAGEALRRRTFTTT
jgi:hypothetical protein